MVGPNRKKPRRLIICLAFFLYDKLDGCKIFQFVVLFFEKPDKMKLDGTKIKLAFRTVKEKSDLMRILFKP
jgi:hypothetical protein